MSVIDFAMYISLWIIIVYAVINGISGDRQKFGMFLTVRLSRKRYFAARTISVAVFAVISILLSVAQSVASHKIAGIDIDIRQYFIFIMTLSIVALTASFFALTLFSVTNSDKLSFIAVMMAVTCEALCYSYCGGKMPTPGDISPVFPLLAIPLLFFAFIFYLSTVNSDIITTKIKE